MAKKTLSTEFLIVEMVVAMVVAMMVARVVTITHVLAPFQTAGI